MADFERELAVELLRHVDGVQRDPHDRRRWVQARRFLLVAAEMEEAACSWLPGETQVKLMAEGYRESAADDLEFASPPPDRLTPEERTAILAAVEYFLAAEHDGRHEAESGATHSGYAKLARLSDREPEA